MVCINEGSGTRGLVTCKLVIVPLNEIQSDLNALLTFGHLGLMSI